MKPDPMTEEDDCSARVDRTMAVRELCVCEATLAQVPVKQTALSTCALSAGVARLIGGFMKKAPAPTPAPAPMLGAEAFGVLNGSHTRKNVKEAAEQRRLNEAKEARQIKLRTSGAAAGAGPSVLPPGTPSVK